MNSRDQRLLEDLRAQLDTVEPGADGMSALAGPLREVLLAQRSLIHGVDTGPERYQVSFVHFSGFSLSPEAVHAHLEQFIGTRRDPWGYFNPACPHPTQRNQVLQFQVPGTSAAPTEPSQDERLAPWRKLGIPTEEQERMHAQVRASLRDFYGEQDGGLSRLVFLRVLVCEGPALLGWVGVVRPEPFEPRELHLLRELTPSLQRRLRLDSRLREAGVLNAALEVALESLGQPAYVVTKTGRVAYANSVGQARLAQDAGFVADALRKHLQGEPHGQGISFTPLRLSGTPTHYLAISQNEPTQAFARVQSLSESWGLTAREAEVFGRLVRGESNKAISLHLGCAERTVEVHVTRILAKAQVGSRSALIARCFLNS